MHVEGKLDSLYVNCVPNNKQRAASATSTQSTHMISEAVYSWVVGCALCCFVLLVHEISFPFLIICAHYALKDVFKQLLYICC